MAAIEDRTEAVIGCMIGSVPECYAGRTLGMVLPAREMHPVTVPMEWEEGKKECHPRQILG